MTPLSCDRLNAISRVDFLLAAVGGRVLARSFHAVLSVVMLEHVQAHVAPTDVDPGVGLYYTMQKGGTTDLKVLSGMLYQKAEEEKETNKQRLLELAKDHKKQLASMPRLNLFKDQSYDDSFYIDEENFEALYYEDAHLGMSFEKSSKFHF
ncbi:hypothetical protein Tco_0830339 [Tanacetum coccineum]